jgi:hypothetical protein
MVATSRLAGLGSLLVLVSCSRGPAPSTSPPPDATPKAPTARTALVAVPSGAAAHPARRCGECHVKMENEWRDSAHARAAASPLYKAMQAAGAQAAVGSDPADDCARCHAPLLAKLGPADPAAREGVTCDVCHSIPAVDVGRDGARFTLALQDNIKYGPRCDTPNHYFHKMGCSPLHRSARVCAGCHLYYRTTAAGQRLPVFTEYEEWQAGPHAARDTTCQDCHMPSTRDEVAVGAGARADVPHHGFLGGHGQLRGKAIELELTAVRAGSNVRIVARVTNRGAGHAVPSGLPERRLVLRVRATDARGGPLLSAERRYGRLLTDDRSAPVPFYLATRAGADNRLKPGETRKELFQLDSPAAGSVTADAVWLEVDPDLARQWRLPAGEEELLASARVSFGSARR